MAELTSSFGRAAHGVAEAARLLNDPALIDDARALREAASSELAERRRHLGDAGGLAAVEADVRHQLAALALLQHAREHFWKAEALWAQADAIQRRRGRGAFREHAREHAEQVARQLADLPNDPALEAFRRFLINAHELDLSMADDEEERAFQAIDRRVIQAKQAWQGGARGSARRLRARRLRLRVERCSRRLVRFAVSFGLLAYGVDQLTGGARDRGAISVLVALAVWLITRRLGSWADRRQDKAYERWFSGFLNRVAWARWSTDFARLVEKRLRQLEADEDRASRTAQHWRSGAGM